MPFSIFCDFDRTITIEDATNTILETFASSEYRDWNALWQQDMITGRECIERQTRLIRARPESLRLVAASLSIDSGIYELEDCCARAGASLVIVSDGLDVVMDSVLKARGLAHITHYSNKLFWANERSPSLEFPFADSGCEGGCGVCRCRLVNEKSRGIPAVYIGNGLSDRCVAGRVERLFAKGRLREYCLQKNIKHQPFTGLSDVAQALFGAMGIESRSKSVAGSRRR